MLVCFCISCIPLSHPVLRSRTEYGKKTLGPIEHLNAPTQYWFEREITVFKNGLPPRESNAFVRQNSFFGNNNHIYEPNKLNQNLKKHNIMYRFC